MNTEDFDELKEEVQDNIKKQVLQLQRVNHIQEFYNALHMYYDDGCYWEVVEGLVPTNGDECRELLKQAMYREVNQYLSGW